MASVCQLPKILSAIYSYLIIYMPLIKKKHIESFLSDIEDFAANEKHKMILQQHKTPPELAAQHQDLQTMVACDLGVGTGILTCGLAYIGAMTTIGMQIDSQYLHQSALMLNEKVQGASFQLILCDIKQMLAKMQQNYLQEGSYPPKMMDLVLMNPPFGTKQANADSLFLEYAMLICSGSIYSMHKSSTRKYIYRFAEEHGYNVQLILGEVKFPLQKKFKKYHKMNTAYTEVDVIRMFKK